MNIPPVLIAVCFGLNWIIGFTGATHAAVDESLYLTQVKPLLAGRCYACHGALKQEAGLRLDTVELLEQGGGSGPALVAGSPEQSLLLQRVAKADVAERMPPEHEGEAFSPAQVELLRRWIADGAARPAEEQPEPDPSQHWAFQPIVRPPVPTVTNESWVRNPIDAFIAQRHEAAGLNPAPPAEPVLLLRRLHVDLVGVPPDPQVAWQLQQSASTDWYNKMVEQLLADPRHGQRWARHWMDIWRYSDWWGLGEELRNSQKHLFHWRDWIVENVNRDRSYAEMLRLMLAADELKPLDQDDLRATGYLARNYYLFNRHPWMEETVEHFGKAMLGLTTNCAKCHDHKYDPFSQKNYYQLYSFFNNVKEVGIESTVGGPETYAKKPMIEISNDEINKILKFINKQDTNRLIVSVMGDRDTLRKTFILERGAYDAPGAEVMAGTPESILSFDPNYPKNRLGLSQWLFDKGNPLTSRVFVNQLWQEIFGRGIVKTAGDFGMQGELPTHPELLDWLSVDFMTNGWNMKRLVKQMVMSATYRQSAVISPDKLKADPENIFLSRAPRYRIKAELVRDLVLSSSGLLVKTIGGPSVKPYQPPGLWETASSGRGILRNYKQDHDRDLYRRGMYTFIKRTVPPPVMGIFDASNRDQCDVNRLKTNTPLQALIMMNDPTVLEASRVLAAKLDREPLETKEKVIRAFRLIVCRKPSEKEIEVLSSYYSDQLNVFKKQKNRAESLLSIGEYPLPQNLNKSSVAAWMQVISALYNLEETITKT